MVRLMTAYIAALADFVTPTQLVILVAASIALYRKNFTMRGRQQGRALATGALKPDIDHHLRNDRIHREHISFSSLSAHRN
jgi:hypothetical protein